MQDQQKALIIRQSNHITNARYTYTKSEKNIMYHVMIGLNELLQGGVEASDLFNNHLTVNIPYSRLKRFDPSDNLSRNLKSAVKSLRTKDFGIKTPTGWTDTGFTTFSEYKEGVGLTVEVSKALVPVLVDISKNFTAYDAVIAMSMQSKYSQRFYELCRRWRDTGWFEFTPAELNEMLMIDLQVGSLNERVISVAQKELKRLYDDNQCDVYFTVEEERGGRGRGGSVVKWRFHVHTKDKKAIEDTTSPDMRYVVNYLARAFGDNPALINSAIEKITAAGKMKLVADRLQKIKPRGINNLGGYVRTLLTDEFSVKL